MTTAPKKGGFLAREAAMLCQDQTFRLFLDRWCSHIGGVTIPDGTHQVQCARDLIVDKCGIESRAELDHNPQAVTEYRRIKHEYQQWCKRHHRQPTGLTRAGGAQ
jgi:hypothetical protein